MSDIFLETIIEKKREPKDIFISIGAVVLGLILCFAAPILGSFALLAVAAIIYGVYYVISSANIEYEYIVTNGELDVDKIVSRKRRKRLITVKPKDIEMLAHISHSDYNRHFQNREIKKINVCSDVKSEDNYFILTNSVEGRKLILFQPDEKMLDAFKRTAPSKVFIA